MSNKNLGIGILIITAVILFVANLLPTQPTASAADSIKDRDYSLVTGASTTGGEVVYVIDNRSGLIAVFVWDANRRGLAVKDVRPIADAFAQ